MLKQGYLLFLHQSLYIFRYLDDILLLCTTPSFLTLFITDLCSYFTSHGLLISTKSQLTPVRQLVWLGKNINCQTRSIQPTLPTVLRSLALSILFPLVPLHKKLLQRITGVLLWTGRPIHGITIFLAPLYNNIYGPRFQSRPRFLGFASNTACRGLLDLVAFTSVGWKASLSFTPTSEPYTLFVDAAVHQDQYYIGIFHPSKGIQIHIAPPHIQNQQTAELFGLMYAIKLATSLQYPLLHLYNDNRGALFLLSTLQPRAAHYIQVKLLRQVFNLLWWSKLTVHLYWVPSFLNPADPPSRLPSVPHASPFNAYLLGLHKYHMIKNQTTIPQFCPPLQL